MWLDPLALIAVGKPMKPMSLPLAVIAAFGVLLGGCATLGRSGDVSMSVVNILPTQASLFETTAALTLRLTNETTQPLTLAGSSHKLYLNGTYVGRAVNNERLAVPQLGTATQTVTIHLENLALVRELTQISNAPRTIVSYRLESRLHAADREGFGRLRTHAAGELDVGALMGVAGAPTGTTR